MTFEKRALQTILAAKKKKDCTCGSKDFKIITESYFLDGKEGTQKKKFIKCECARCYRAIGRTRIAGESHLEVEVMPAQKWDRHHLKDKGICVYSDFGTERIGIIVSRYYIDKTVYITRGKYHVKWIPISTFLEVITLKSNKAMLEALDLGKIPAPFKEIIIKKKKKIYQIFMENFLRD